MKIKRLCSNAIIVIWAVSAACALWAPLNVIDRFTFLGWYMNIKHELFVVLGFQKYIGYPQSSFPQVSELYFSIIWLTAPFMILLFWILSKNRIGRPYNARTWLLKEKLSTIEMIKIVPIIIFMAPICFAFLFVPLVYQGASTRYSFLNLSLGDSRYGLAFFGVMFPFIFSITFAFIIMCFYRLFERKR